MKLVPKISNKLIKKIKHLRLIVFDFDGVFTDNKVYISENNIEMVKCDRSDGLGIKRVQELGVKTYIISSEKNSVVSLRSKKLGVPCLHGINDKKKELEKILKKLKIKFSETLFVGNDINDLECLSAFGLSMSPIDCSPEVHNIVNYISKKKGGDGFVREVCDMVNYYYK